MRIPSFFWVVFPAFVSRRNRYLAVVTPFPQIFSSRFFVLEKNGVYSVKCEQNKTLFFLLGSKKPWMRVMTIAVMFCSEVLYFASDVYETLRSTVYVDELNVIL